MDRDPNETEPLLPAILQPQPIYPSVPASFSAPRSQSALSRGLHIDPPPSKDLHTLRQSPRSTGETPLVLAVDRDSDGTPQRVRFSSESERSSKSSAKKSPHRSLGARVRRASLSVAHSLGLSKPPLDGDSSESEEEGSDTAEEVNVSGKDLAGDEEAYGEARDLSLGSFKSEPSERPLARFKTGAKRGRKKHHRKAHHVGRDVSSERESEATLRWTPPGFEQGADTRSDHPHLARIRGKSRITVCDYSSEKVRVEEMGNEDIEGFLRDTQRPEWGKVRWINVNGLSWDVVKALANHYDIHPLATEDIFNNHRIKCDSYENHMYLSLVLLAIHERGAIGDTGGRKLGGSGSLEGTQTPGVGVQANGGKGGGESPSVARVLSTSPLEEGMVGVGSPPSGYFSSKVAQASMHAHPPTSHTTRSQTHTPSWATPPIPSPATRAHRTTSTSASTPGPRPHYLTRAKRKPQFQYNTVSRTSILNRDTDTAFLDARALARGFEITIEQVSVVLMKDGTVISFFRRASDLVTPPIYDRLHQPKTLIRSSQDASFLVNSLIDDLVDHSLHVIDFYGSEVARMEVKVLDEPKMRYTKELHLIQAELNLLKRTLTTTQSLVSSLANRAAPGADQAINFDLISKTTKTYLSDVLDNCNTCVENIDSLDRVAEDLINLIFNSLAFYQNQTMQTLTIANIIFLPITFLAGVYGTNFKTIPEIQWQYGYIFFWCLVLVVTTTLLVFFRTRKWYVSA